MDIKQIIVGEIATNCYLIAKGKSCLLIDPGDEAKIIKDKVGDNNLVAILLTHGHFDHILAINQLHEIYPLAKLYISSKDHKLLKGKVNTKNLTFNYINECDLINFDDLSIKVIETPGHTPGSVCYKVENNLFSGDTLFYRTIGRTDFPGGNIFKMQQTLAKLAKLPDETKVFPGHGKPTTIGEEKRYGYLKIKSLN